MKREMVNRRVVMCDFDEKVKLAEVRKRWRQIAGQLWPGVRFRTYSEKSPSGRGLHFWAVADKGLVVYGSEDRWGKFERMGVLLAQCLMGSDIKRERANLARISAGVEDWNRLFSTKRVDLPINRDGFSNKKSAIDTLKKMGILKP